MDAIQIQALKDLLHLIVDKEGVAVLQDLVSKLPAQYISIGQGILAVGSPVILPVIDKAIDAI